MKNKSAFTLIEVTLSLAIVAFVLLTMMALMPVGLKMMSDSHRDEISANIITELRGQFQQMPFTANGAGDNTTIYTFINNQTNFYDYDGNYQTNTLSGGPMYQALFSLGKPAIVNGDTTGIGTNNMVLINIQLLYPLMGTPAVATSATRTNSYTVWVAKQIGK